MCFSALVRQDIPELARRYGAQIAYGAFAELFRRRLEDKSIKVARALERSFLSPKTPLEEQITADIEAFRRQQITAWETEVFTQRKRLADAERSLQQRETKRAREHSRIATHKIQGCLDRLADARRLEAKEVDTRIFPMVYAPVMAYLDGRLQILPMRYTCRLAGKPANYDVRYAGTYNARRDNLDGFWRTLYGKHHAIMLATGFFENVPRHLFEHRNLLPGEAETNLVLKFNPRAPIQMSIACLWDRWTQPGERDLLSFAAVTDEPPPEIAVTGHQRCIIALKDANVSDWLSPEGLPRERLDAVLNDPERPYYEHRVAA
jgi:putative SOS response-associated peptidase YedK